MGEGGVEGGAGGAQGEEGVPGEVVGEVQEDIEGEGEEG